MASAVKIKFPALPLCDQVDKANPSHAIAPGSNLGWASFFFFFELKFHFNNYFRFVSFCFVFYLAFPFLASFKTSDVRDCLLHKL